MNYRGIPGMKVHLYRWGELKRELRGAGFQIQEVLPLDEVSAASIDAPWFAQSLRAGGWIVFAVRRERGRYDESLSTSLKATAVPFGEGDVSRLLPRNQGPLSFTARLAPACRLVDL